MNMLSFLGETPTIALRNAQEECGEEAIVISTKKISSAADGNKDMYEVVVALEDDTKEIKHTKKISTKSANNEPLFETKVYDFKEEILKMQDAILQVQKTMSQLKYTLIWGKLIILITNSVRP